MLIVARLLQGAAGAILSPSVFSITLVTFAEGAERNKALGILGGIAGSGAAIGVLLGGVFTEYIGWQWIFFVNIPIAALALALVPRYVRESRADGLARHFDTIGAVTVTGEPDAPGLRPDAGEPGRLGLGADDPRLHRLGRPDGVLPLERDAVALAARAGSASSASGR